MAEIMQVNFAPAILVGEQTYFAIHHVAPTDITPRFSTSIHPAIPRTSTDDFVLITNHSVTLTDALNNSVFDQAAPFTSKFGIYASTGRVPTYDLDDIQGTLGSVVSLPTAGFRILAPPALTALGKSCRSWRTV
ncbi:MAG: hypothetical protein H6977_19875 [Gammaproteobacteria bacterium]|nr:hypothetical protein [Gammaproteobacteria bacterium]